MWRIDDRSIEKEGERQALETHDSRASPKRTPRPAEPKKRVVRTKTFAALGLCVNCANTSHIPPTAHTKSNLHATSTNPTALKLTINATACQLHLSNSVSSFTRLKCHPSAMNSTCGKTCRKVATSRSRKGAWMNKVSSGRVDATGWR